MKESLDSDAIPINDTDNESFQLFITYFYGMDPLITASNIGAMAYLADKYLVDGLHKICISFLQKSLSLINLIDILDSLILYHQNKLFDLCKQWMTAAHAQQTQQSMDDIMALFTSDAFMHSHHMVVNILLSGFAPIIDASKLWQCTAKWVQINRDEHKWSLVRQYFPFYKLPIEVLCSQVLPKNILTQEMALEVLSHKCNGYQRDLAKYCISHANLNYPLAENQIVYPFDDDFNDGIDCFFEHNLEEYNVSSDKGNICVCANEQKMLYSNIGMEDGHIYEWNICVTEWRAHTWHGFGMDAVNDLRQSDDNDPGRYKLHSYGLYLDQNNFNLYANGNKVHCINEGAFAGITFLFRYDAIYGRLDVIASDSQKYTFSNIDTKQIYYPSFKTAPGISFHICPRMNVDFKN